jgi:hypothetical protein
VAATPAVRTAPRVRLIIKDTFIVVLLAVGKKLKIIMLVHVSFLRATLPSRPKTVNFNPGLRC